MQSGIYKITCKVNSKFYIGSSQNILLRWNTHKNHLRKNKHINVYLQSSWNKYGEDSFLFEILEYCKKDELINKEQEWLDLTKCYERKIGFNACVKSDRPLGYKHLEKDKFKMSLIKKEQYAKGIITSNFKFRKKYNHTEETKEKIKQSKLGEKNPMYGKKLTEEERKIKGLNLNSVPRWNKGLTKENDIRILKLASRTNMLPSNAIKHTLIDIETNEKWEEKSLKHLSEICPLSISTLNRLKVNKVGEKIMKKYKIIW